MGRLSLLTTSPRVAPGLMSRTAWQVLGAADHLVCRAPDEPSALAIADADLRSEPAPEQAPAALARHLVGLAHNADVVWLGSADGDPGLSDAIAGELSRLPDPPEVELLVGSWDVPGARLLDVVAVMDRLRSPGGCPWDARQTHDSLAPYLLEETHEVLDAIVGGQRSHLLDELGDVLLQVVFHARVAEEHDAEPFDIDDIAGNLVAKLVRRHPHVFADGDADTPEAVAATWEEVKAAERADRGGGTDDDLLHGIPETLPALALATKVLSRAERRGAPLRTGGSDDWTARMLALVAEARAAGIDPETTLRAGVRSLTRPAPEVGPRHTI